MMGRYCLLGLAALHVFWAIPSAGAAAVATPEPSYPECPSRLVAIMGDGDCSGDGNIAACGFDGGDCCDCTCVDTEFNSCGTSGYSCIDPGAPCDVDFRTWSPTFTPTSSPSSSIVWDDPSALDDVLTKSTETSYESSFSVGIIVFCILAVCGVVLLLGVFLKKRLKPVNSHTGVHDLESTLLHPAETGYVPNV